jgi:HNH endonuclease
LVGGTAVKIVRDNLGRFAPGDRVPLFDRLVARSDAVGECVEWSGYRDRQGYGRIRVDGESRLVHRVAWQLFVGGIPDGLTLDHLCRNHACWRPGHLEPVTLAENKARGESPAVLNARKTHCARGHEYTPENTIYLSRGGRVCRECNRQRQAARYVPRPWPDHCPQGHAYTPENTGRGPRGERRCRECARARDRARRAAS